MQEIATITAASEILPIAHATHRHIPALDGVRGVAILMVLAFHLFGNDSQPFPVLHFVYRLTASGWMGVDLFFVLSGFLITGILLDTRKSAKGIRNFYIRRMLRIFPLYYGLVICGLIGAYFYWPHDPATNGPLGFKANQLWLWTYTINFRTAYLIHDTVPGYNAGRLVYPHFWSLAIEEQFYLIWPLIILTVPTRAMIKICVVLLVAGLVGRIVYYITTQNENAIYLDTQFRLDGLVAGALACFAYRSTRAHSLIISHLVTMFACGSLGFFSVIFYTQRQINPIYRDGIFSTLGYSVLAISFALIILALSVAPPGFAARQIMQWRPLRLLGKYSYGIYALHLPIIAAIGTRFFDKAYELVPSKTVADIVNNLLLASLTIVIAFLSFHLYEMQFLRLKRFFPN